MDSLDELPQLLHRAANAQCGRLVKLVGRRRATQVLSTFDRRRSLVYHANCPTLLHYTVDNTLRPSTGRGESSA